MKTISYTHIDKSSWKRGLWDDEPDKVQWQDKDTNLPCLIVRNHMGAWCGYVGVTKSHPDYEKHYDDVSVDVHGGLTFASKCSPNEEQSSSICHLVEEGEDDDVWWLGFDCLHACDFAPSMRSLMEDNAYRDINYVKSEVTNLAKQLKERI